MDIKELCFSLCEKAGTSGDESLAAEYAKELLNKYMPAQIDVSGSVVGSTEKGKIHILLDAHIDSIGLVVRGIDEKGYILVDRVGGMDEKVLTGAEVTIHGKEELFGVICSVPPHLQKGDNKKELLNLKEMAVDIGYTKDEAEKYIEVGDRITLRPGRTELLGNNIASCSLDDRSCVAVILRALELTEGKIPNLKLTVLFSSQEETGGTGAKTAAYSAMPQYAIAVDVGFGNDPYTDKAQTIELSKGPSIGISPILDRAFIKELKDLAKENDIPFQHDVMSGRTGTNADSINVTGSGVKTALLSLPLRYMHTGVEIVNLDDIENTAKLIAAYLLKKEAECNA